jgi:hypothetical protein
MGIVAILLVNMLIAMMGNTYQKIAETRNEWQRQVTGLQITNYTVMQQVLQAKSVAIFCPNALFLAVLMKVSFSVHIGCLQEMSLSLFNSHP